jgi:protein-L-isoaspartate(D-aspartate) O-methyltransferase
MRLKFLLILWLAALIFFVLYPGCSTATNAPVPALTDSLQTESPTVTPGIEDDYLDQMRSMIETIQGYGVQDEEVLQAMRAVPRHEFVPETYLDQAYDDHPLPIGYGQTISQPFIVAWMTELLDLKPGAKVLEIGTGSGYQAAVLAALGSVDVYSIEIIPELAQMAERRLYRLGYGGIHLKQADGYYGWAEFAPFDAIIVTAAPDHLPAPLAAQIVEGGCIVIPIGPPGGYQSLWKFVDVQDELKAYNMGGVSFVPFRGEGAAQEDGVPSR